MVHYHCTLYMYTVTVHCPCTLSMLSLSTVTVHGTLYIVQLYSGTVRCHDTLHTATIHCHRTLSLYTVHCTLYTVHCTLYTVHCTLYTVLFKVSENVSPHTVRPPHWLPGTSLQTLWMVAVGWIAYTHCHARGQSLIVVIVVPPRDSALAIVAPSPLCSTRMVHSVSPSFSRVSKG